MVARNSAIASDLSRFLAHAPGANLQQKMDRDGHLAAKLLTKSREFESAPWPGCLAAWLTLAADPQPVLPFDILPINSLASPPPMAVPDSSCHWFGPNGLGTISEVKR